MGRRHEGGAMLIDLVIGVFIGMMMLGAYLQVATSISVGRTAHREGARLAAGAAALQKYLIQRGASIVSTGTASGFVKPLEPSDTELKQQGFIPPYLSMTMPFGGTMQFAVQRSANNDLLGLACDSSPLLKAGQPAPDLAAKVMAASSGTGLMSSIANPARLNGPGMADVVSPINSPAIVCAWAFLPNPV
jgi:hypothetical protein